MEISTQSDFEVRVTKIIAVVNHPNADRLDLATVYGYTVIVRRGEYKPGDLATYIPLDSLVPTDRPEFAFLAKEGKTHHRVKAAKLRGVYSQGLLVPAPANAVDGQDVEALLGVLKYVSPEDRESGTVNTSQVRNVAKKGPKLPVYGLSPLRKYGDALPVGTPVVITEKIHGSNARFVSDGKRLWVGSHKVMRGCTPSPFREFLDRVKLKLMSLFGRKHRAHTLAEMGDIWWQTATRLKLKERLAKFPNMVLYGEIYGQSLEGKQIQKGYPYDTQGRGIQFRAFDVYDLKAKKFLDYQDFVDFLAKLEVSVNGEAINQAPVLDFCDWPGELPAHVREFADSGKTLLGGHHRTEGVVVRPWAEIQSPNAGRVHLKYAGEGYLLDRAASTEE